jgi:hypothetical protein
MTVGRDPAAEMEVTAADPRRRARGGHARPSIPTARESQLLARCATWLRTTAGGLIFCVCLPSAACAQNELYADADGHACWRRSQKPN